MFLFVTKYKHSDAFEIPNLVRITVTVFFFLVLVYVIAERLSARHLILLHCWTAFVCMHVCIYLCPVAHAGAVQYGSLPHLVRSHVLLRMCALTVSGARWCGTGCYSIKYIHNGVVRLDSN